MPRFIELIRIARQLPLKTALARASGLAGRRVCSYLKRRRDLRGPTYCEVTPSGGLYRYYDMPEFPVLLTQADAIRELAKRYLEHRFDLLGSGWTKVSGKVRSRGLEGYLHDDREVPAEMPVNVSNRTECERIRNLVDDGYEAIDWHLDFKSGYPWQKDTWYGDVPYGHLPGVDIKVPWELARMQNLPALAFAYSLAEAEVQGFRKPDVYLREFRNQVLDFVADNPPRFGVNWRCTMDVAIRVANWLVAHDLFLAAGGAFDREFEAVFIRSVFEHAGHIAANLEWDPQYRANHYLADIVGLLFAAVYLPTSAETDAWLALSVQELIAETDRQFLPDGGNFEGSTAYHRLSAELAIHATALTLALGKEKSAALDKFDCRFFQSRPALHPAPLSRHPLPSGDGTSPFPENHFRRLAAATNFMAALTKSSGRIAQIGDNDSGRFLKLAPTGQVRTIADLKERYLSMAGYDELPDTELVWDEDPLDSSPLLAAAAGLLDDRDEEKAATGPMIETQFIAGLVGQRQPIEPMKMEPPQATAILPPPPDGRILLDAEIVVPGDDLLERSAFHAFPDFGLYVWKSERLFLSVRCGPIGQNGRGGHAHNDQLAIELAIDGEDWIVDPGTYLYTPLPAVRNTYRSVRAHFTPRVESREPGRLDLGPFWLGDEAKAECLYAGPAGFLGTHSGFGDPVARWIAFGKNKLHVIDLLKDAPESASDRIVLTGKDAVKAAFSTALPYSPGYGIQESAVSAK